MLSEKGKENAINVVQTTMTVAAKVLFWKFSISVLVGRAISSEGISYNLGATSLNGSDSNMQNNFAGLLGSRKFYSFIILFSEVI